MNDDGGEGNGDDLHWTDLNIKIIIIIINRGSETLLKQ